MSASALGVLLTIGALLLSVMLHEAGHMLTAKAFGMKVTQYFLGFGRTLWSFRRGETEYGVKAIPAGGFVKIVGMTDVEEIEPADQDRAFYQQPAPQRLVVLAAGSVTHFILAFVIFMAIFGIVGSPRTTTTIDRVTKCVDQVDESKCAGDVPTSPAARAGVQPGDRVISFGGQPVNSYDELGKAINSHAAGPTPIVVERDGKQTTLTVSVERHLRPYADKPETSREIGLIGIAPRIATERDGVLRSARRSGVTMWQSVYGVGKLLKDLPRNLWHTLSDTTRGKSRDVNNNTPISLIGATRLGGQALKAGDVAVFLLILGSINVVIGVMNLLPLLPLDGGHIAILLFEKARAALYRRIGRRDPGRVDIMKLQPVALAVIVFFGAMTLILVWADLANPILDPFKG
jgi:membrane-associated protease RseP (regulator of RpoE activity)